MSIPYRHIAIEGGIGAGKSTLATALAERLGTEPLLEPFADNPFQEVGRAGSHADSGRLIGRGDPQNKAKAAEFGIGPLEVVYAGSEVGSGGDVDDHSGKGRTQHSLGCRVSPVTDL